MRIVVYNKMLDIISMITLLFIFIGLPIILIIIGGNDKTEEEQRLEDEEQMEYLKEYSEKKLTRKVNFGGSYMEKLYTWEQVEAYSIIALHNLLHSANEVNLKNIKMFIEPLQSLYRADKAVEMSKRLINKQKQD